MLAAPTYIHTLDCRAVSHTTAKSARAAQNDAAGSADALAVWHRRQHIAGIEAALSKTVLVEVYGFARKCA